MLGHEFLDNSVGRVIVTYHRLLQYYYLSDCLCTRYLSSNYFSLFEFWQHSITTFHKYEFKMWLASWLIHLVNGNCQHAVKCKEFKQKMNKISKTLISKTSKVYVYMHNSAKMLTKTLKCLQKQYSHLCFL